MCGGDTEGHISICEAQIREGVPTVVQENGNRSVAEGDSAKPDRTAGEPGINARLEIRLESHLRADSERCVTGKHEPPCH